MGGGGLGHRREGRGLLARGERAARRGVRALGGRSEQAGMFLAAAEVPATFQRTLMPRSFVDQGVATGLVMGMSYAIGALVQDVVDVIAMHLSGARVDREHEDRDWRRMAMAVDVAAIAAGVGLRAAFREREDDPLGRAAARAAGRWLAEGAAAGLAVAAAQEALHGLDERRPGDPDVRSYPVALPAGGIVAVGVDWLRRRREAAAGHPADAEGAHVSTAKSLAIGTAVTGVLAGLARAERAFASGIGRLLGAVLPGHHRAWRPVGHAAALAAMAGAVVEAMRRVDHQIEAKATRVEPAFDSPPTSTAVSGGPGSAVPFETLSRQGRRNVSTALTTDQIRSVMGKAATAEPIRVFVGLDSAPTPEDRVRAAMEELERTGAFDRELLMVISPTGTGYVNYVAVEAAEYMTLGNVASVALQYSKRPSVLSLDRVALQRRQYRLLVEAIHRTVAQRPNKRRSRVVLFGESLGAWTSEDAFAGSGTGGLEDLGVDRAIWIGTPHETRWKDQIAAGGPDVDPTVVGTFNDFGQLEALGAGARKRLRYVMISHDNDAVAKFGLSLLFREPSWLGDPAARPPTVPSTERWSTPTTFVLTLVDMKNAANVIAGQFEAKGHDYRADLARFVREVYGLRCTDQQLDRVEAALRQDELMRKERIDERDKKPKR